MTTAQTANAAGGELHEYLGFFLGREEYVIDILRVQEIRGYDEPTPIMQAPPFIKGVINLRGNIVPIVDLRLRFNLPDVQYTPFTVVIVLNVCQRTVGVVVDSVSDVFTLAVEDIHPAPSFATHFDTRFIKGLANLGEKMLIVTDIEQLMGSADMALVDAASDDNENSAQSATNSNGGG